MLEGTKRVEIEDAEVLDYGGLVMRCRVGDRIKPESARISRRGTLVLRPMGRAGQACGPRNACMHSLHGSRTCPHESGTPAPGAVAADEYIRCGAAPGSTDWAWFRGIG